MALSIWSFSFAAFAGEDIKKTIDDGPEPGCVETKYKIVEDCGYDSWYAVSAVITKKKCSDGRLEFYLWTETAANLCSPSY